MWFKSVLLQACCAFETVRKLVCGRWPAISDAAKPRRTDPCLTRAAAAPEEIQEDAMLLNAGAPAMDAMMQLPEPQAISGAAMDSASAQRLKNPEWWAECADGGWPTTERMLVDWSSAVGFLFYLPDSQVLRLFVWHYHVEQSLFISVEAGGSVFLHAQACALGRRWGREVCTAGGYKFTIWMTKIVTSGARVDMEILQKHNQTAHPPALPADVRGEEQGGVVGQEGSLHVGGNDDEGQMVGQDGIMRINYGGIIQGQQRDNKNEGSS